MKYLLIFLFTIPGFILKAQDPHFTQFYSAPLSVNPAYTGVFSGKIRLLSNSRIQYVSAASSFNTVTFGIDGKLGKNKTEGQNPFNAGILLMHDNSLNGIVQSNYATAAASYHIPLDEDAFQTLGIGFSAVYGNKNINFSELSFGNQFLNGEFNLSVPSGENALNNMKPFITGGAGLLYQNANEDKGSFFDIGVSCYNFNKPKQTVIKDQYQFIPIRFSGQISYQKYLSDDILLSARAIYQNQAATEYYQGGLLFEKLLGAEKEQTIGAGAWYRSKDAVSPYLRLGIKQFLIGMTYDIPVNDLKSASKNYRSMEVSLQYIFDSKNNN